MHRDELHSWTVIWIGPHTATASQSRSAQWFASSHAVIFTHPYSTRLYTSVCAVERAGRTYIWNVHKQMKQVIILPDIPNISLGYVWT